MLSQVQEFDQSMWSDTDERFVQQIVSEMRFPKREREDVFSAARIAFVDAKNKYSVRNSLFKELAAKEIRTQVNQYLSGVNQEETYHADIEEEFDRQMAALEARFSYEQIVNYVLNVGDSDKMMMLLAKLSGIEKPQVLCNDTDEEIINSAMHELIEKIKGDPSILNLRLYEKFFMANMDNYVLAFWPEDVRELAANMVMVKERMHLEKMRIVQNGGLVVLYFPSNPFSVALIAIIMKQILTMNIKLFKTTRQNFVDMM